MGKRLATSRARDLVLGLGYGEMLVALRGNLEPPPTHPTPKGQLLRVYPVMFGQSVGPLEGLAALLALVRRLHLMDQTVILQGLHVLQSLAANSAHESVHLRLVLLVLQHVVLEVLEVLELPPALEALAILRRSFVHRRVFPQVGQVPEEPPAFLAFVLFRVVGMYEGVYLQVAVVTERFGAYGTLEGSHVRVVLEMVHERFANLEAFATFGAEVRPVLGVAQRVLLEQSSSFESLFALGALVGSVLGMGDLVLGHDVVGAEGPFADVAFVRLFSAVDHHVHLEALAGDEDFAAFLAFEGRFRGTLWRCKRNYFYY